MTLTFPGLSLSMLITLLRRPATAKPSPRPQPEPRTEADAEDARASCEIMKDLMGCDGEAFQSELDMRRLLGRYTM